MAASTEREEEEQSGQAFQEYEDSSVEFSARRDTILYQIRGLFIGYAGLEYLNRVVQQSTILSDASQVQIFNAHAERLYSALGRYNSCVELISQKNIERLQKKYGGQWMDRLEETAMDLFASAINDSGSGGNRLSAKQLAKITDVTTAQQALIYAQDLMIRVSDEEDERAYDQAEDFYEKTLDLIDERYHVDPDVIMVIAFFGFYLSLSVGYMAAYECIRMLIQDYNRIYGWDFFHVQRSDYSKALADLRYENIRGDQTTSIDSKAMLQLIVYGAWNNKKFNEPVSGKWTPGHVFVQAGLIDFLGYMKEYHRAKFQMHWETAHNLFKEIRTLVEGPLMRNFRSQIERDLTEVETKFKPQFQELAGTLRGKAFDFSKSCVFQVIDDNDSWRSGSLPLTPQFVASDFSVAPSGKMANVSLLHGSQGCLHGSTRIITSEGIKSIEELCEFSLVKVLTLDANRQLSYGLAIPLRTGRRVVFKLSTTSGYVLATDEHRFLDSRGFWRNLRDLRIGDRIVYHSLSTIREQNGEETILATCPENLRSMRGGVSSRSFQEAVLQQSLLRRLAAGRSGRKDSDSLCSLSEGIQSVPFSAGLRGKEALRKEVLFGKVSDRSFASFSNRAKQEDGTFRGVETENQRWQQEPLPQDESRGTQKDDERSATRTPRIRCQPGQDTSKRGVRVLEELLHEEPSSPSKQPTTEEQDDIPGECGCVGARDDEPQLSMEQDGPRQGWIPFSRFSDLGQQCRNRMQRGLLAQGRSEGREETRAFEGGVLLSNRAERRRHQERTRADLRTAVVLSIERYGENDTFDLHVPVTNNYVLANGLIVHNSGKTTLLSRLASVSVLDQDQVVFIPLSDDMNWPATAFVPQMEIEDHKRDNGGYYFNKSLGIQPEGLPTIILDVVKDVDELAGIPLTKYDRIIKVNAYTTFDLDMDMLLGELKEIASQDFGYSSKTPRGIIAARYLHRKGADAHGQRHSHDLTVANTLVNIFLKWRENNVKIPFRIQTDEAAEAGTSTTQGPEQFALKQSLEQCIRITRRGNLSVDLASQLAGEISSTIRNQSVNSFFKNLKQDETKKSPLEIVLRGMTDDEGMIDAVKLIQRNPMFIRSHLMFGHTSLNPGELFLMQTMPAPFMPQIPSLNTAEIYRAYLKQNLSVSEEQFLMRQPEIWIDATKDSEGDSDGGDGEGDLGTGREDRF